MTPAQGELFALPVPTRGAARCQLGRRYGSRRACSSPAVGTVADWTAPLDPTLATPSCEGCARLYGAELDVWLV